MSLSARALNRATLARQMLLARHPLGPLDALRSLLALQAQSPASPYLALWNRLEGFSAPELDAALTEQAVVRTTLMRITMHAVHHEDYRPFREAMEPTLRPSRLGEFVQRMELGWDVADALVDGLLRHAAQPRSAEALDSWLEQRLGRRPDARSARLLRTYAPLLHVPAGGPWSFDAGRAYTAARPRPTLMDEPAAAAGLATLVRRYLAAFGPASIADVAQFAMVQRQRVRPVLMGSGSEFERLEGPAGEVLFDLADAPRPEGETPAPPRLLGMWDNVMLAYFDRSRIIPPHLRAQVTRMNGDVLPVLLLDGYVAGVWRAIEGAIEVTAFELLAPADWDLVAAEAAALGGFLSNRDPAVYRRYHHWWEKLPAAEVRRIETG